ncbi:tRNA delta(2)-isopentenylpyrophosphate transferase [Melioribacter roseus P3M-2]|uniref:tRNA dimethylallyltransferase n=1 Tax=Melioribacter roseus (strain DSM 23840 / JCM 17771 / VKM B-2668 / P3M-2) TaxID=1191523 RepID=I6Z7R0_MELRP|nr:tRNA (adenosine(37)-N6)-dimethylallyltransferase MiaA [Melioribacter roseus]AFN75200.1 tRNA delta(2)-isopentenylpyrophosphate transferase [Melioribacter roseus P3M-2]
MAGKVILIVGPTCSGKTKLSLKLAEVLNTEIISADSRQIYKYLNIGTAKPSDEELKTIKHHFIDYLEPDIDYNVSRYEKESLQIISELINNNKVPVVAGGSGLYIKAIVDGIFDTADTDEEYRAYLKDMKDRYGNEYIYGMLEKIDPLSARTMLPQNWKRVIRALEVYHLTGKSIVELQKEYIRKTDFEFLLFGLLWDRKRLYDNIETRVDDMIERGLISEVENILSMGYNEKLNSLNTVGYKEIINYLKGNLTLEEAIGLVKRNTRRYAKRQMTWFRKDERIEWLNVEKNEDIDRHINYILSKI